MRCGGILWRRFCLLHPWGVPFIRTGGLADVIGSLPKCIDKKYFDVRIIMPKYACISQKMKIWCNTSFHFYMDFHWKQEYVGVFEAEVEGITYYFIDNESLFGEATPYSRIPYLDILKFTYFSKAVFINPSNHWFQTRYHTLSWLADGTHSSTWMTFSSGRFF